MTTYVCIYWLYNICISLNNSYTTLSVQKCTVECTKCTLECTVECTKVYGRVYKVYGRVYKVNFDSGQVSFYWVYLTFTEFNRLLLTFTDICRVDISSYKMLNLTQMLKLTTLFIVLDPIVFAYIIENSIYFSLS